MRSRGESEGRTTEPTDGQGLPRRDFIVGALSAAGLAAGGLGGFGGFSDAAAALGGNAARRNAWSVPEAAWVRDWGLAGPGPCTSFGDPECRTGVPTVIPGAGPSGTWRAA